MTALFFKMLEMSITGSIVILVTVLARFLLRKRSKKFIMILWAVAAIRLLLPVNIESVLSIYNYVPIKASTIISNAQIRHITGTHGQVPDGPGIAVDYSSSVIEMKRYRTQEEMSVKTRPDHKKTVSCVWLSGAGAIAVYYSVRFVMLKRKLRGARMIGKDIYESDKVTSPFVFGLLIPKIYLPEVLDNTERECILKHERTHIRHGDWISKMIGLAVVCVHWFNPVVWLGYVLFEQDLEMRCDEAAVSGMDYELKTAYTMAIVSFARRSNNRRYLVTPLGFAKNTFGKAAVTKRVKNIVNHKKGTVNTTIAITMVVLLVAASLGLNAKTARISDLDYYGELSRLKVVFPEGYHEVSGPLLRSVRSDADGTGLYIDDIFYYGEDEDSMEEVVFFGYCDINEITDNTEYFSDDDYLSCFIKDILGFKRYIVLSREERPLSGQPYTLYRLLSVDENDYAYLTYVFAGRIDEDHYSGVYILPQAGDDCFMLNWFVD